MHPTQERVGNWLRTYTGKRFYPLDPRIEEIDIEDIAHALSMLCRFGGHCRECVLGISQAAPTNLRPLGRDAR